MGIRRIVGSAGALVLTATLLLPAQSFAAEEAPERVPVPGTVEPFTKPETRLQGKDRYATAVQISKRYEPGLGGVYVATGDDFPDALSAGAAAAHKGYPLLLTGSNSLPEVVKVELERLKPAHIYVAGGTGAVSSEVFRDLESYAPTTRISGKDRYETSRAIVDHAFDMSQFAVIATGRSFPDALAATSVAGKFNGAVILVDGTKKNLSRTEQNLLDRKFVGTVLLAGGTGVLSRGIEDHLEAYYMKVDRRGGKDRYETSAKINTHYFQDADFTQYMLATGENFPDALAGGALAARYGEPQLSVMPMYLTRSDCMPDPVSTSIERFTGEVETKDRVILGGESVVSGFAAIRKPCE